MVASDALGRYEILQIKILLNGIAKMCSIIFNQVSSFHKFQWQQT
jgi:hypothetical protein